MSEHLLTCLEVVYKGNIKGKNFLWKIKLNSENYLPQQFSILFHLLSLKTFSREKSGLVKMNEASVSLVLAMGSINSGREIMLQLRKFSGRNC